MNDCTSNQIKKINQNTDSRLSCILLKLLKIIEKIRDYVFYDIIICKGRSGAVVSFCIKTI